MWLLVLIAAALAASAYLSQRRKGRGVLVEQLWIALRLQYPYQEHSTVTRAGLERLVSARGIRGTVQEIRAREQARIESEQRIYLGERSADTTPAEDVRAQLAGLPTGADSTREYRHLQHQYQRAQTALQAWDAVAETTWPVSLPDDVRARHLYVLGKTGAGKSTLLKWLAFQDAHHGHGLAFLTPDGETIEELLPYLPDERSVTYFNPADPKNGWHLNPFWVGEGDDFDQRAERVFSLLARMLGDVSPRVQQILRHAVYALLEIGQQPGGATLLDLPPLLESPQARAGIVARMRDPETRAFWEQGYDALPTNAHLPITTRLVPFLRPRVVRRALCRPGRGLDVRKLLDDGCLLFANLSDGVIGETASALLGGMLVAELQLASLSRANTPASTRRPFYVYLDEFGTFVDASSRSGVSYERLLSRSRKYGMPLVLAHQQSGQLDAGLLREILGNVGALVTFETGRDDALRMSRELLDVNGKPIPPEMLQRQAPGEAWARIGRHALSFRVTTRLEDQRAYFDSGRAARIKAANRFEVANEFGFEDRYRTSDSHERAGERVTTRLHTAQPSPLDDIDPSDFL